MGWRLRIVLHLTIADGKIGAIDAVADPAQLHQFDVTILDVRTPK